MLQAALSSSSAGTVGAPMDGACDLAAPHAQERSTSPTRQQEADVAAAGGSCSIAAADADAAPATTPAAASPRSSTLRTSSSAVRLRSEVGHARLLRRTSSAAAMPSAEAESQAHPAAGGGTMPPAPFSAMDSAIRFQERVRGQPLAPLRESESASALRRPQSASLLRRHPARPEGATPDDAAVAHGGFDDGPLHGPLAMPRTRAGALGALQAAEHGEQRRQQRPRTAGATQSLEARGGRDGRGLPSIAPSAAGSELPPGPRSGRAPVQGGGMRSGEEIWELSEL